MYMITNEQANRLFDIAKHKIIKGEKINRLLSEIESHKPTNGDKWRAMSDEQIADSISADGCSCCPLGDEMGGCVLGTDENLDNVCKAKLMNWLKQEASK